MFSQSVAVLELNGFNLSGTLPSDMGALRSLSAVTLSDNPGKACWTMLVQEPDAAAAVADELL